MDDDLAAALLGALAHPTRLAILRHLVRAGPAGDTAGAIATAVAASPSRASFHLAAMTEMGLLASHRDGRQMIYGVNFARLGAVVAHLIEECCAGAPALRAACQTC